ncbi:Hypothetical protein, putative [Bodo saltans]|uniref:Uncharacterized protein n=1 Tax=Bodo saltans TaxID=75058 RepID=A0A0S4KM96_BODSA|nr:Hypothetical protein, putative [Bodo saltans]|eukprot:CUI14755.1 Hypothetical protein, putative [Bodo saltans]
MPHEASRPSDVLSAFNCCCNCSSLRTSYVENAVSLVTPSYRLSKDDHDFFLVWFVLSLCCDHGFAFRCCDAPIIYHHFVRFLFFFAFKARPHSLLPPIKLLLAPNHFVLNTEVCFVDITSKADNAWVPRKRKLHCLKLSRKLLTEMKTNLFGSRDNERGCCLFADIIATIVRARNKRENPFLTLMVGGCVTLTDESNAFCFKHFMCLTT